jgi:hypothetical protein
MSVQTAIRVHLPNRPDELASMAKWLAQAGVNIESIAGVSGEEAGTLELLVNYPGLALNALRDAGISCEQTRVALAWLPNRPGTLALATEALADAKVNIDTGYVVRTEGYQVLVAFASPAADRADSILSTITYD